MNRRTIRFALLAFLLLVAQIGAAAHALSHLEDRYDGDSQVGTCVWCPAYATVVGPPAEDSLRIPGLPPQADPARSLAARRSSLTAWLAYRSQAPPRCS